MSPTPIVVTGLGATTPLGGDVASTWEPYTAFPATWGDWVIWEQRAHEYASPDIRARRISTGEELWLTDDGAYNGRPTLRGDIACWGSDQWGSPWGWDLVVFDMETGALRRVTRTSHPGYKCGAVDSGWLVYQKQVGEHWQNEIHAADLVAAGILDPSGQHVIPEQ